MRLPARLLLALLASCSGSVHPQGQASQTWARFNEPTAWIFVGLWNQDLRKWGTLLSHEVVGPDAQSASIPSQGDVIRITHPQTLYLLDYKTLGESKNRESPAGKVLTPADETGSQLEPGAIVEVLEVAIASSGQSMNSVWARVRPASKNHE